MYVHIHREHASIIDHRNARTASKASNLCIITEALGLLPKDYIAELTLTFAAKHLRIYSKI